MKKSALLCTFIILIGAGPVFAADSNNIGTLKQLQTQNSQLYQEIMNLKNQIKDNLAKIKPLVVKNKELRNIIKTNSTQDIDTVKNQIKNNRAQIKALIRQNKGFRGEITNKVHNQTR